MKPLVSKPLNGVQEEFNALCQAGGGQGGGPPRGQVQKLLARGGQALNAMAYAETRELIDHYRDYNPWHVCFAIGLAWGHLAKLDSAFVGAAARLMDDWNPADLREARRHHYERGPEPIEQSLSGGHQLFSRVLLPETLPTDLARLRRFQDRWWTPILSVDRPRYIGSWNATAMFMVALFAQPNLAATMTEPEVMLPPGGPIHTGLKLLHEANLLSRAPAGTDLDDAAVEPGAVYENNTLMAEILKGHTAWSLIDVHSGLYMLGTRYVGSSQWYGMASAT